MNFIGIDGCKAGWFYVGLDGNGGWKSGVVQKISDLSEYITASDLTLIDIPIGLRESEKCERRCDKAARKVLGKRRSSVFPAPYRPAINCAVEDRSRVNFQCTGRKLSQQSLAIVDKVRQVDEFLREADISVRQKVREIHPEVCFWALNNYTEMAHNKKKQAGFNERLAVLLNYCNPADEIVDDTLMKYRRKCVAKDDVIDGLVGAVTAIFFERLGTLPEEPEVDATGLPMEIVYAEL